MSTCPKPGPNSISVQCQLLPAARADDQDEAAIDKRHGIYYDTKTGTLAAVNYFRARAKILEVDGAPGVKKVSQALLAKLG